MEESKELNRRRIGHFRLSGCDLAGDKLEAIQRIFAECIVTRAEFRWDMDCIEYTAISRHFGEVPEWCRAPHYTAMISWCDGEHKIEWNLSGDGYVCIDWASYMPKETPVDDLSEESLSNALVALEDGGITIDFLALNKSLSAQ